MKRLLRQQGFALITVILMLSVLLALFAAYSMTTSIELATSKMSKDSVSGFYAAEAGLNIRAEEIRQLFLGYNRPTGSSPSSSSPCSGGDDGSGDFQCQANTLNNHTAMTYVLEDGSNPIITTIPPGERYQGLNAQEYRYTVHSVATNTNQDTEAILELRFKSRLVPLFQFAAFYNKDLEILPGPAMTLQGPVHTNGDLYLNANTSMDISGQVTAAGSIYRGRKNDSTCMSTNVRILDPAVLRALYPSCPSRRLIIPSDVTPYNGMLEFGVTEVTVPEPEVLDPTPGQVYWDKADIRLVLNLNGAGNPVTTYGSTGIEVRNADNSVNVNATAGIHNQAPYAGLCPTTLTSGATLMPSGRIVSTTNVGQFQTNVMYNWREDKRIRMLDLDLIGLLNCLHQTNWFGSGKRLDDSTEGGLVVYLTVSGPNSTSAANEYGVRIRNANTIASSVGGAPVPLGLTVVSDQALYTYGHYNRTNKKPAALLSDSMNILSTAWSDANSWNSASGVRRALTSRIAAVTTVNAAILSGTDTTGGTEGAGGQGGAYNGGLENFPRFHEDWASRTMTYSGSWVSLNRPRHVSGSWANQSYSPPPRNWSYDTSFNNAANLPPITPRFVYLRQELFVRDFER